MVQNSINKNTGFTLVETLVAIAIFTMSILGLMSVMAQGISDTNYTRQKITATYLAQEGIEYVRNMRDDYVLYTSRTGKSWVGFKNKISGCSLGNECGFDSSTPDDFINCSTDPSLCKLYFLNESYGINTAGEESGFVRKIWADSPKVSGGIIEEIKVYSEVSWTQGSGSHSVTFSEILYNWWE